MARYLQAFFVFISVLLAASLSHAQTPAAPAQQAATAAPAKPKPSSSMQTGESYAAPTYRELIQTMFIVGGVDLKNPKIADEYLKLNHCGAYKQKYKNDFELNNYRQDIISRITSKKEYYRTQFEINGVVYLGRYNFETQDFPFVRDSALVNVGSMSLFSTGTRDSKYSMTFCEDKDITTIFPGLLVLSMKQPLTFDRLKMPMDEAEKLLAKMESAKNEDRKLYVRFRFRITSVDPGQIDAATIKRSKSSKATFYGDMRAIDLFFDKELTQHVATIQMRPEL